MSETIREHLCPFCASPCEETATVCPHCATPLPTRDESAGDIIVKNEPSPKRGEVFSASPEARTVKVRFSPTRRILLRSILLLLIAALLFGSLFLPFAYTDILWDQEEFTLSFRPLDAVNLAAASLIHPGEEIIVQTPLYQEIMETEADFYGRTTAFLLNRRPAELERHLRNTTMLKFLRWEATPPLSLYPAALAALLYIAATILLFLRAISLLLSLRKRKKQKTWDSRADRASALFFFLAMLMPAIGYSFHHMCRLEGSSLFVKGEGFGLTVGFYATVAAMAIALVLLAVLCLFTVRSKRAGQRRLFPRRTFVAIGMVLLLLFSPFLPAFSLSCYEDLPSGDYRMHTVSLSAADFYEGTQDIITAYAQSSSADNFESLLRRITAIANNAEEEEGKTEDFYRQLTVGIGRNDVSLFYTATLLVTFLLFLFLALLLSHQLSSLLLFTKQEKGGRLVRLLVYLLSSGLLGVMIALMVSAMVSVTQGISKVMTIDPSLAMVTLTVGVIGLAIAMKKKKTDYMEGGYDNADVSYSPYVITGE